MGSKLQTAPAAATTDKGIVTIQIQQNHCYEILHPLVKIFRRPVRYLCSHPGPDARNGDFGTHARPDGLRNVPHQPLRDAVRGDRGACGALPQIRFVVRKVEGDVEQNREQIVNAFKSAGFSLRGEEDGVMTFRADGPLRKLMLLGEDEIKVSQYGQWIQIDGIRRGVARVEYRLDSYIQMSKHD